MSKKPTAEETKANFKKAERNQQRANALHEFAAEPRDLYADAVTFNETDGILRIGFHCSRPDSEDMLGYPTVPVARISFPYKMFRYRLRKWLLEYEKSDALWPEPNGDYT